mmetsp:Transcript_21729/g.53620  ORF Transcript_21729/g.53620 Transcript_21729/m.53620 type:complete len:207 (+) Transcript_21729:1893-2513(+)
MGASGYPTLGLVAPVHFLVDQHVDAAIFKESGFQSDGVTKLATAVQKKLRKYAPVVVLKEIKIAAALDPRAKSVLKTADYDLADVRSLVMVEYEKTYKESFAVQQAASAAEKNVVKQSDFTRLLGSSQGGASSESEAFPAEFDRWMAHAPLDIKSCLNKIPGSVRMDANHNPDVSTNWNDGEGFLGCHLNVGPERVRLFPCWRSDR